MNKILIFLIAAAAASGAMAAPAPTEQEARIPFISHNAIRTFHAADRDTIYLQDRQRQWYRADVIGACLDLPWAHRIGVDTRGSNTLDRFSTLLVNGERCQIGSLVKSGPPPKKAKKRADG